MHVWIRSIDVIESNLIKFTIILESFDSKPTNVMVFCIEFDAFE